VYYVVLDTCVLVNCTLMNAGDADPELLVTISNRMREKGLRLLLPAVIELEYSRKVPEELARIKQQTKKFRKAITTEVLTAPDVSALHQLLNQLDNTRNSAATRAQEYFSQLAADDGLTVCVPLSGDILAEATTYVLAGRKPAKQAARGLLDPDCLIVASIASFARSQNLSPEDTILICSDNHSDFGVWSKDADRHTVAADIAAAIPCSVRYYKSPRTLVEEELQLDVQADPPLAQALDEYEGLAKTMASVTALTALEDYFSTLRAQNVELFKNLSIPNYAELLKNLSIPNYAELFKNLSIPNYAELFKNLSIPNYAELFKNLRAADLMGKEEDEESEATNASEDEVNKMGEWTYERRMRELLTYLSAQEGCVDIPVVNGLFPPEAKVVETAEEAQWKGWVLYPPSKDTTMIKQIKITPGGRTALAKHVQASKELPFTEENSQQ